jgi:hypothetical protein
MKACGLTSLPDRRTFYRRLSTISADIKERIAIMASLFVKEKLVDPYIIAIDSTLLRTKGHRFFCKETSCLDRRNCRPIELNNTIE